MTRAYCNSIAFTLVELVLVLAITAVLSGAAVLKLLPLLGDVALEDVVGRVEQLDQLARTSAHTRGKSVWIVWSDEDHRGYYCERNESSQPPSDDKQNERGSISLGQCSIKLVFAKDEAPNDPQSVACSSNGFTASYAVCLTDLQGKTVCVFFAGLTGQSTVCIDERQARKMLAVVRDQERSLSPNMETGAKASE